MYVLAKFKPWFYKNNHNHFSHYVEKGTESYKLYTLHEIDYAPNLKKTLHPSCENPNDGPATCITMLEEKKASSSISKDF